MDKIDQLIDQLRILHREQHVSAYGYRVLLDALGELKEPTTSNLVPPEENPCGGDR